MPNSQLPQPPLDYSPESLHQCMTDIINYLRQITENGLKLQGFTQNEIDNATDPDNYIGTILLNTDTNIPQASKLDTNGNVVWEDIIS